jgi:hypothetical protein
LIAILPDGTEASGNYGPMFGKQQLYRPPEGAPTTAAAPPPASVPAPKSTEPAKGKQASEQIDKAVDVLRGLFKK